MFLGINQIDNEGVLHLVNGLVANTVSFVLCMSILLYYCYSTKTVTTLDLTGNRIGVAGIQYLAQALNSIKVSVNSLLIYRILIVQPRH
jgi:hypothetical protein